MSIRSRISDAFGRGKRAKARDFARELSYQLRLSPLCSDYENMFAQVRPLIDEMKTVIPYGVGRNGGPLPLQRTPELYWLRDPNDEMGWSEFADLMFATWLTEDELDIHVWKNKRGEVEGYTILPPETRMYLGYGRWEWQVLTTDGMEVLFEEDVMRLRFSRSPRDIQKGVSPASASRVWAQLDDLVAQYQRAYFENGAVPATITFIRASSEAKYNAMRHELESNTKGARNKNKTVYVWRQFDNDTGDEKDQIEVKPIQGNNSTLAIREIVDIINDRLNKSVGVSNFILGDDSSAKYDNAELSDHQFTKRRVYPALVSFWNQFEHELNRVVGGNIGYHITFDLEIPELTERVKVKAEIARIRTESLVNLISAGATGVGAVEALGLPKSWETAANAIWAKGQVGELNAPISIEYKLPKAQAKTHKDKKHCTCHHTLDELPPMTKEEKQVYDLLVMLSKSIMEETHTTDVDATIREVTSILQEDARTGAKEGATALELLANEDVASEIRNILKSNEIYTSEKLKNKIADRTTHLVRGYSDYTTTVMNEVLTQSQGLSANEIKQRLSEVMPVSRAELIARNETVYAIKSGRIEQDEQLAKKYGLKVKLVWRTSHDNKVCPVCAAMDGKETMLGEAFVDTVTTEDGEVVSWDHSTWNDGGTIPDAHPNCRCYFDEVLVEGE